MGSKALRSKIVWLWFRLVALATVGLVFAEALHLGVSKVQGWTFYLTSTEVIFEVALRLVVTALLGIVLGTLVTLATASAMGFLRIWRNEIAEWAVKVGVVLVVFVNARFALSALIKWSYHIADHRYVFDMALYGAFYLVCVLSLCFRSARDAVLTSLDPFLSDKFTCRAPVVTIALAAAFAFLDFAIAKSAPPVRASATLQHPKSNVLLITFDALAAEDLSGYGYDLPTSPNLDAFANKATVFTNYYAASTFTTPCVATMLTGMYPSQTHVYQLQAKLDDPEKTVPELAREGGYTTAAFFSNPYAHYLAKSIEGKYDLFGEPVFERGGIQGLWSVMKPLHQDSRFGNRAEEYMDLAGVWNDVAGLPDNSPHQFRAAETFEQARALVSRLPDGFFLWIHVMTPHGPFLPDSRDRGRFLPADVKQIFQGPGKPDWKPHYQPSQQKKVDEWHLRYDEFILTADRAFGEFISYFEKSGKAENTTVIVSADHGESFSGGIFEHGSEYLTRPIVHIPLLIHRPGQQASRRVSAVADQTALAPTLLELAGLRKPDWMPGDSLVSWLTQERPASHKTLAFSQYFEKNSVFKPLAHGTVGVIDGEYQYVLDLDTRKGRLRPLAEAQIWNLDKSNDNPAKAQELLSAIYSRFPELKHNWK